MSILVEPSVKGSSTHHICGIPPDLGKFHDFTSNQFEINQLVITLMTFFFRIVTDIVTDQQGRFFFPAIQDRQCFALEGFKDGVLDM